MDEVEARMLVDVFERLTIRRGRYDPPITTVAAALAALLDRLESLESAVDGED